MNARPVRAWLEHRQMLSLAISATVGAVGLHAWPFPAANPILLLIRLERPLVYASFSYTYAAVWFSTSFFLSSIILSLGYIFVSSGVSWIQ